MCVCVCVCVCVCPGGFRPFNSVTFPTSRNHRRPQGGPARKYKILKFQIRIRSQNGRPLDPLRLQYISPNFAHSGFPRLRLMTSLRQCPDIQIWKRTSIFNTVSLFQASRFSSERTNCKLQLHIEFSVT